MRNLNTNDVYNTLKRSLLTTASTVEIKSSTSPWVWTNSLHIYKCVSTFGTEHSPYFTAWKPSFWTISAHTRIRKTRNYQQSPEFDLTACRRGVIFCVFQAKRKESSEANAKREMRARGGALDLSASSPTPLARNLRFALVSLLPLFAWNTPKKITPVV